MSDKVHIYLLLLGVFVQHSQQTFCELEPHDVGLHIVELSTKGLSELQNLQYVHNMMLVICLATVNNATIGEYEVHVIQANRHSIQPASKHHT